MLLLLMMMLMLLRLELIVERKIVKINKKSLFFDAARDRTTIYLGDEIVLSSYCNNVQISFKCDLKKGGEKCFEEGVKCDFILM